jgi:hypothetical protein
MAGKKPRRAAGARRATRVVAVAGAQAQGPRLKGEIVELPEAGPALIETLDRAVRVRVSEVALLRLERTVLQGDRVYFTLYTHDDGTKAVRDLRLA